MKKILLFTLVAVCSFNFDFPGTWAQETGEDEFVLKEIVVTSEKRAENLQELPSSVVVLPGEDLVTQGKITTSQILESVPNTVFRNNGGTWSNDPGGTNPNGNIAIRGIQRTQNSGGINEILPASTGVYVDGVYQGTGGNYDINRVEVLRGPQGTLYGRSATGGVVSFFTNDPKLKEFGGNATAEFGTANLINMQGALNVPIGEKVALRAAAHYSSRDGYYNEEGGKTETKGGRIKALFKPNDALRVVLSLSLEELVNWGGGPVAKLTGPNDVFFEDWGLEPEAGAPQKYRQFAVNADYNFGKSTLTWIGGYHDFDFTGYGPPILEGGIRANAFENSWTSTTIIPRRSAGPLTQKVRFPGSWAPIISNTGLIRLSSSANWFGRMSPDLILKTRIRLPDGAWSSMGKLKTTGFSQKKSLSCATTSA